MSGNKITKIEGLDNLVNLRELKLCGNNITKIEGLDNLVNLR
jgi:Leucine-rich repeat (LRR) protein